MEGMAASSNTHLPASYNLTVFCLLGMNAFESHFTGRVDGDGN